MVLCAPSSSRVHRKDMEANELVFSPCLLFTREKEMSRKPTGVLTCLLVTDEVAGVPNLCISVRRTGMLK